MARPVNADPARTRERLLAAAAAQFSSRGLDAASLREVARSAGVTLATIHYYFGNKRALYDACLDQAYARVSRELAPMAELFRALGDDVRRATTGRARGIAGAIDRIVTTAFRFSREHRAIVQLIMRPVLEGGELDERWRDTALLPFLDQTSAIVAAALGRDRAAVRLDLQSVVSLVMRYSLSAPAELARVAGLPSDADDERAIDAVERHLVGVAQRLLAPERS